MVFQIFQKRFVLLRELRAVVCEQIIELERYKLVHPFGDGFGGFVFDGIGPCEARVIVLHRQDGDAVELREVGLEKVVRAFPVERPCACLSVIISGFPPIFTIKPDALRILRTRDSMWYHGISSSTP